MPDTRLIERWLPIAELGIESTREQTAMAPHAAPNRLHVWWARRPLVASRAAVLASVLPEESDRQQFMRVLGIHGNPVAARRKLDEAKRKNEDLGPNPYGYKRAFNYAPSRGEREWVEITKGTPLDTVRILDPTAGGGSIPFEAGRIGFEAIANDLNPVATLILKATVDWPAKFGTAVAEEFANLAEEFLRRAEPKYEGVFSAEPDDTRIEGYLWARTITCPYCEGLVPLSPNWRLASNGTGVKLVPHLGAGRSTLDRVCSFKIVTSTAEQSTGTVMRGAGTCPYSDCGRVIDGEEIKMQAQGGHMGEQLFAVVYKKRIRVRTKSGKAREKWIRGYRAPRPEDDNSLEIGSRLSQKLREWIALDLVPIESIPNGNKTSEPRRYGMNIWRDLFSPRQLLCHGTSVEIFHEMLEADRENGDLTEVRKAAYGYLALALDKLLNYNSRMSVWMPTREVIANTFNRHDFAFCWSHAEMAPLITGTGYNWAIRQTAKCIKELVTLVRPKTNTANGDLFNDANGVEHTSSPITITCKSGDSLDHLEDRCIDAVIIDPPYEANVMYAELSDFFYVWAEAHCWPRLPRALPSAAYRQGERSSCERSKIPRQEGCGGPGGT